MGAFIATEFYLDSRVGSLSTVAYCLSPVKCKKIIAGAGYPCWLDTKAIYEGYGSYNFARPSHVRRVSFTSGLPMI